MGRFAASLVFIAVGAPLYAFAAFDFPNLGEPLTITVEPQTVPPHTDTTIALKSYLVDLDRSSITWFVNGKQFKGAENKTTFTITAGPLGSETEVSALVETADGTQARGSVTIHPVSLELLWEADTYTPPLYRGRALGSPGATIIAHAEAHFLNIKGVALPETDIVYNWSWNGKLLADASGRGRSTAHIPITGLYGDDILAVDAASLDGVYRATVTARSPSMEPLLTLHPYQPLLAINYDSAVERGATLPGSESTLAAIPYFSHSTGPRDRGLSYHWFVDGREAPLDSITPFLLTLTTQSGSLGAVSLEVLLENSYNFLQEVRSSWGISLDASVKESGRSGFPTTN